MTTTTTKNVNRGTLYRYDTNEEIREATAEELEASRHASERDGGAGVIEVDGVLCYVLEDF